MLDLETITHLGENLIQNTALVAMAGVVSATALYTGISYIAGIWPWIRKTEDQPFYVPTNFFTGKFGPMKEFPGTNLVISPFLKVSKIKEGPKKGELVKIPGDVQQIDINNFEVLNSDAMGGTYGKVQITYEHPDKKSAWDFQRKVGGDISKVQEIITGKIQAKFGGSKEAEFLEKQQEYCQEVVNKLNKFFQKKYGVLIRNISLTEFAPSSQLEEVISEEFTAKKKAQAARIQAEATKEIAIEYIETAERYKKAGSKEDTGDIALILQGRDNIESIAGNPNINTILSTSPDQRYLPIPQSKPNEE